MQETERRRRQAMNMSLRPYESARVPQNMGAAYMKLIG